MSCMTGGLGKPLRTLLAGGLGAPASSTVITVTTYHGGGAVSYSKQKREQHLILLRTIDGILVSQTEKQFKIVGTPHFTAETKIKLYGILEKHIESLLYLKEDTDENLEKELQLKKTLAEKIGTDTDGISVSEKQIELIIASQTKNTVEAYIKISGTPISKPVIFRKIRGKKSLRLVLSEIMDLL